MARLRMYNPPHPGEMIYRVFLEPNGMSIRELAENLGVASSTLSRIVNGSARITAEMAIRLSKSIGRSPDSWLNMQNNYDIWIAMQNVDFSNVRKTKFAPVQKVAED